MIQFKHYSMSSDTIGTGDVVFKRYAATKSRFAQFVEGTLTELLPEDFGNITTIGENATYGRPLVYVKMPDTITTVKSYNFSNEKTLKEIIFSANITTIEQYVCPLVAQDCIIDFSRAKSVPTINLGSNSSNTSFISNNIASIKVPSSLYNTWKNANIWKDLASKIVAV